MSDYFYLCCNCGGIAPAADFEAVVYDDEDDDSDPAMKCPLCGWLHEDDDRNPGIEDGTRLEVARIRREYLTDPIWAEMWAEEDARR